MRSLPALPAALDPTQMPNGGASVFLHANLDTAGIGARIAKPLLPNLSLYGEGEAGWTRLSGSGWSRYAQATAGVALRF